MNNYQAIPISKLQELTAGFIEMKRSTGVKYVSEERHIRYFVRFCQEHYHEDCLPNNAIFDWIEESDNRSLKTKSNMACMMAEWAKYMFSLGYEPLRIPEIRYVKSNSAFIPHIFTTAELQALWNTVDHIEPSKLYPNLHRCIPVLFRMLYSCGLRINEALSINLEDIDFDTNCIILKHTKLDRERIIPLEGSMTKVLKGYIQNTIPALSPDEPIFFYKRGITLPSHSIYQRFRWALSKSGIPYEGRLRGPRLHDFRHTFAVFTMNKLFEQKKDIAAVLPIISAYLGHAGIESTERYLRLTEDRLTSITDSMEQMLPNMFPEVEPNEEI